MSVCFVSLDNLDIIAESADCHVESFVLLVTILDTATFGSDIIHAVCLAIGKVIPDLVVSDYLYLSICLPVCLSVCLSS